MTVTHRLRDQIDEHVETREVVQQALDIIGANEARFPRPRAHMRAYSANAHIMRAGMGSDLTQDDQEMANESMSSVELVDDEEDDS